MKKSRIRIKKIPKIPPIPQINSLGTRRHIHRRAKKRARIQRGKYQIKSLRTLGNLDNGGNFDTRKIIRNRYRNVTNAINSQYIRAFKTQITKKFETKSKNHERGNFGNFLKKGTLGFQKSMKNLD